MAELLQEISDFCPPQPLPKSSENANKVGGDVDSGYCGATAEVHGSLQEAQSRSLPEAADTGARRKGSRILAPNVSGKADAYTSWRSSFRSYSDFHTFIGYLTGRAVIDVSRVCSESKANSAGYTARNLEDNKAAHFALRACCTASSF